jgi:glycosyltransferase involved in cell wall biosynthesis
LHLTTFYPPFAFGGDAAYVQRLAHALGEAGHAVDVVHSIDAFRLLGGRAPAVEPPGHPNVRRHGLRSRVGWLSPLLSHQTGRPLLNSGRIRRLLRAHDYDVVHFHNISLLGPAVLTLDAGPALKLYTAHEQWLVCPTHVLWKFNQRPCEAPECLRCTLLARRPPQAWRYTGLLRRCARQVDQFLAPSRFTVRIHEERGFPARLAPLPLFAERADDEWRNPGPRPHQRPYFLFVGRLEVVKGLQRLLDVFRDFAAADLLVAGTGSEEATLRAQAAANPRVRFLGRLPPRALGPLYVHSVACVVPSVTFENFPTVVVEAFARKAPVVARALGGLVEMVEESGGGLLFRRDEELPEAMMRLAASPRLRRELGENGYQTFSRLWTPESHLARYFTLLRELAIRKHGRVPWEQGNGSGDAGGS